MVERYSHATPIESQDRLPNRAEWCCQFAYATAGVLRTVHCATRRSGRSRHPARGARSRLLLVEANSV